MKLLILGIGNVMYSDEGIGVHFVRTLERNFKFSSDAHEIKFLDGGTLANFLMHIIADYDEILLVDCIDADGGKIGDVYFFNYEAMPKSISWSGSAHEIEMLQTLQMMDLCGDLPRVKILAVVPKRIEPASFELSDEAVKSAEIMEKTALQYLEGLGFKFERIASFSVRDAADEFDKKGRNDRSF